VCDCAVGGGGRRRQRSTTACGGMRWRFAAGGGLRRLRPASVCYRRRRRESSSASSRRGSVVYGRRRWVPADACPRLTARPEGLFGACCGAEVAFSNGGVAEETWSWLLPRPRASKRCGAIGRKPSPLMVGMMAALLGCRSSCWGHHGEALHSSRGALRVKTLSFWTCGGGALAS
jgi:hypothetical protein